MHIPASLECYLCRARRQCVVSAGFSSWHTIGACSNFCHSGVRAPQYDSDLIVKNIRFETRSGHRTLAMPCPLRIPVAALSGLVALLSLLLIGSTRFQDKVVPCAVRSNRSIVLRR